jgi:hAT family C-terminal dimerisation region
MNGAIFDILPSFDYLLQHLKDAKKKFTDKLPIATSVNLAWLKLNEYYEKSDLTSVYVIATILDPRMKYGYFERRWATHQDWIEIAKAKFEAAYVQYRENAVNSKLASPTTLTLPVTAMTDISALKKWKFAQDVPLQQVVDELYIYTHSPVEASNIEPWQWWIVNQHRFPIFAAIARDFLSIPAMSSEVERVFSGYHTIFTIVDM